MTYRGTVKKGVVVFDDKVALTEGTVVSVQPVRTFYERYKDVIGKAKGLPRDFADNHDHYIHATPKRKKRR